MGWPPGAGLAEVEQLKNYGADLTIMGERPIVEAMLAHTLADCGPDEPPGTG